jgi:hypothetical protein
VTKTKGLLLHRAPIKRIGNREQVLDASVFPATCAIFVAAALRLCTVGAAASYDFRRQAELLQLLLSLAMMS